MCGANTSLRPMITLCDCASVYSCMSDSLSAMNMHQPVFVVLHPRCTIACLRKTLWLIIARSRARITWPFEDTRTYYAMDCLRPRRLSHVAHRPAQYHSQWAYHSCSEIACADLNTLVLSMQRPVCDLKQAFL